MAMMIDGHIEHEPMPKHSRTGEFIRSKSLFRGQILNEQASANRFHLYVSYACPWAHRTLIVRNIKKLEKIVSVSVASPYIGEQGWVFDPPHEPKYLAVVYLSQNRHYTGRITVPVLWDKKVKGIVNNESSEIIRILNSAFDHLTGSDIDLYPEVLRERIDRINDKVYEDVNNGVYKAGFAGNQKAYEKAAQQLFLTLEELEKVLSHDKFLAGDRITEADIRLFTTLIRFDSVYYVLFKCNLQRISDYPHLFNYMKSIYQIPEVKETFHFDHIKEHYYRGHTWLNPIGIVPIGPLMDLDSPHNRGTVDFWRNPTQDLSPSLQLH